MAGVNKVIIVGNLGRDPEIKYTQDNRAVANYSVAVSESWKDKKTGEWQEKTEWIRCVAFGYAAEKVEKNFAKGKQVYIEGKIQTRDWDDKDGKKHYMTEVVSTLGSQLFCTGRKEEGGRPAGVDETNHFNPPPMPDNAKEDDDDLPF